MVSSWDGDKAEEMYTRAFNIREKVLGADHPDIAQSCNNLGLLYKTRGELDKACTQPHRLKLFVSAGVLTGI